MTDTDYDQLTDPIESDENDLFADPPPAWPKWIGGLAIAFGAFSLTCGLLGAAIAPFQSKLMEGALAGDPMPEGMKLQGFDWGILAVSIVLALVLLFGGIFCVTRQPISRIMILAWGVISIPLALFNYVRGIEKQESIREWAQQYPNSPLAQSMNNSGATGAQIQEILGLVLTILLGVLIPAFFLLWFGFIKTKSEQMTGSEEVIV